MTDPKNMDYVAESGAVRNFEPWREGKIEETDEERLRRLEAEDEDVDPMKDLEAKMHDAQRDMAVADALDEIRANNAARNERAAAPGDITLAKDAAAEERERQDKEDTQAARLAFQRAVQSMTEEVIPESQEEAGQQDDVPMAPLPAAPVPSFKRSIKKKKDFKAALGIKKKV